MAKKTPSVERTPAATSNTEHAEEQHVPRSADTPAVAKDPNVVDFDGPDDPENPMNWTTHTKTAAIALVSVMTLLSPVGSTISSAAAPDIMADFGSQNETIGALVTTIYILGVRARIYFFRLPPFDDC